MQPEHIPKKRGRKPLPPEEKSKRGRKKVVHQEIQDRKKEGVPPLQISFVCDNNEPSATPASSSLNPFAEQMNTTSEVSKPRVVKEQTKRKSNIITALQESDDDENVAVQKTRIDVSHLSGEKCIQLMGAHTDREQWPSSTEVACWNCTYQFEGIPISIPGRLHKTKNTLIGCYGTFCSFNCARRYCMNRNRHDSMEQMQLISYLHKKILGNTARIFPAAPVQVLQKFGGYMEIDEYRKNFVTLPPKDEMFDPAVRKDYVQLMTDKQIPVFHTVLHSHNQQLITNSIQEKKVRNKGYDRTTPLPGSQNLSMIMGIKS